LKFQVAEFRISYIPSNSAAKLLPYRAVALIKFTICCLEICCQINCNVKQSRYRPGVAHRLPGS